MYISEENVLANELDFKKALDLLNYVEDPSERESRRLRIWARAILRDAWTQFDTDNVLDSISGTVFFKIIEFSLNTGEFILRFVVLFFFFSLCPFHLGLRFLFRLANDGGGVGEDLADLLPNPEEILQEPQLVDLSGNDVFHFLLKAVYEHVNALMESAAAR